MAAETLKLTSADCLKFNIIDEKIDELSGGAHRYPEEQATLVKKALISNLDYLTNNNIENVVNNRKEKYLNITASI